MKIKLILLFLVVSFFGNAQIVRTYTSLEDVEVLVNSKSEYQNNDVLDGRVRTIIIPSDFDFTDIPANYGDAVWKIRSVHDIENLTITLPDNVTFLFENGTFKNNGATINLGREFYIDFNKIYQIFDTGGTFVGRPKSVKGFISPTHFGAKGDESTATLNPTDNSSAFNATSNFVGANYITSGFIDQGRPAYSDYSDAGGMDILVQPGVYNFTETVTLKAGQNWEGNHSGTFLHFEPTVSGTNFIEIVNSVQANNFNPNQQRYVEMKGFTIHGDVNYDGSGNASSGIFIDNGLWLKIEDFTINKFEYGIRMEASQPTYSAYYNRFKNVDIQQCTQLVYIGNGTAVTSFEDCVFVRRPEFTGIYTHGIEARNNTTFINCSFEGGTPLNEMIYAPIGKITIIGGRDESNSLIKFSGRGVTGSVTVLVPNGPAGNSPNRYGTITEISEAPLEADFNTDQSAITQSINLGQGVAQEIQMLKNQNWVLGLTNWKKDGSGGSYQFINKREDLFGSDTALKITKTSESLGFSVWQETEFNAAKVYVTVWIKHSPDAVLRSHIRNLYARDNTSSAKLKSSTEIIKLEDEWHLYGISLAHYYKLKPTLNPSIILGLQSNSPLDSWAIFSNLRFWVGGYPTLSGSDSALIPKQLIANELPTQSLLKLGDEIKYDGTNSNYPIATGSPKGVICSFNLDTTLSANALDNATSIEVTDVTGIAVNDYIGVWQNDGSMQWSTVNTISTNTITLNDALTDDADSGSQVYIYRLLNLQNY